MRNKKLQQQLEDRKAQGNYRTLKTRKGLVDFCSNDYLGFAKVNTFSAKSNRTHGATGSRLISGNSQWIENLEDEIASFHRAPAGLVFNSGYVANVGLLSCIPQRGDTILFDELAHASIRDGIRLSLAKSWSFKHNDLEDLTQKIRKASGSIYVVVESVYSMDGDTAPLREILEVCQSKEAGLIVDEAHAVGVFGDPKTNHGEGLTVALGVDNQVFARIVTFGKSIGAHGAMVLGSQEIRDYLINFCRPFIYTTALPESTLQEVQNGYQYLQHSEAYQCLKERIAYFKNWQKEKEIKNFIESNSAIQSLLVPGNVLAKGLALQMEKAGLDVRPILHPTVPAGKERLRICLHAFNSPEDFEKLFKVLELHCSEKY